MRTAEAGSVSTPSAPRPTEQAVPKYYVVKGHLADMLARLAPPGLAPWSGPWL